MEPFISKDGGQQVKSCEEGSSKMISEDRVTDVWKEQNAAGLCGLV